MKTGLFLSAMTLMSVGTLGLNAFAFDVSRESRCKIIAVNAAECVINEPEVRQPWTSLS